MAFQNDYELALQTYPEQAGTFQTDIMQAYGGHVVYAGPGNDRLTAPSGWEAYLLGGADNDTYVLPRGAVAVIIDSSGNDTLEAPFSITEGSTIAATVDGGRHLVGIDLNTEVAFVIPDRYSYRIENLMLNGQANSQETFESAVRALGQHIGDIPFSMFSDFAGFGDASFFAEGFQAEMNYVLGRESQLFSQAAGSVTPAPSPSMPVPAPVPSTPWVPETPSGSDGSGTSSGSGYSPGVEGSAGAGIPVAADPGPASGTPEPNAWGVVITDWYLSQNPDVAAAGIDAAFHYLNFGWREGRDPNAFFDTDWYLGQYTDIAAAGINPAEHYWSYGWREGRDPSVAFDTTAYLEANPDVQIAGVNPFEHYVLYGINEGRALA